MQLVINREALKAWLRNLLPDRTLIAPVSEAGLVLYRVTEDVEDIAFHFDNTALSPKEFFFPITDTLFTLRSDNGRAELKTPTIEKEAVLFGIRPCDALGLKVIDRPFLDEPADVRYQQRRERTVLVGLACSEACPECFCTSVGTAPNDASNMDILLSESGEDYLVQAVTERGKALLEGATLKEIETASTSVVSPQRVPAEGIASAMLKAFDSPYWDRVADRCIHCNICSHVCPVCYCFDIRDYRNKGEVERLRTWESCQAAAFTRLAGGADIRPGKGVRMRQRFAHKLLYMDRQFGGLLGCTGCGRCVKYCPVNIDIREIISDIQKMAVENAS
jgi:ferredoxin